jgi:four helix bundle protein
MVQGEGQKGYRGLLAWEKAHALASQVYRSLNSFPSDKRWLAIQAMRAAVSVPANIAEGYSRGSLGDYLRFLDIARGSLGELEYYLIFLESEHLLDSNRLEQLQALRVETGSLLHGLWKALKRKQQNGSWDGTQLGEGRVSYGISPLFDEDLDP